ncbi:MipA/OmpV family protein [Kordiimonas aestuarii]|uniref:MipA/OmpV family protein n=1 Tax=Kordiimonas aestuarii TaxID=1005925 RepID=UPI0021D06590|nr:MipA/OmpV family protein [Kordiimonas aestuarii]
MLHKRQKIKNTAGALTAATLMTIPSGGANADRFSMADSFNNALEAVQDGIDLLLPGDLDSQDVKARIGVGIGWTPDYDGSNNYRFRAIPLIDIRYKEVWRLNGGKFTYSAYKKDDFEAGPLLNLHGGRGEDTNKALAGLGDISTTIDVGAFARYSTKSMLINAEIRQALGAAQGMQIRLTAGHGIFKAGDFAMGAGIRAKWMSEKAMQTNYGITPTQSANSALNLPAFDADAGFSEVSLNVIGAYKINESVRLLGLVALGRLFGSAGDSPLSGGGYGSATQLVSGAGLQFQF